MEPTSVFSFRKLLLILVALTSLFAVGASGQVVVRTVLDQPRPAPDSVVVDPQRAETSVPSDMTGLDTAARTEVIRIQGEIRANKTNVQFEVPEAVKEAITAKTVNEALFPLVDPDRTTSVTDEEFKAICKSVQPALINNFMPTLWHSGRTACFWDQKGFNGLRAARLTGNTDRGAMSVELLTDIFWGLRVRAQTGIAATANEASEAERVKKNLQQLLASGGTVSLSAEYPWYAQRAPSRKVHSLVTSYARVGGTVPILGQDQSSNSVQEDDITANFEVGLLEAQTQIDSFRGDINFVAFGRTGVVHGTKKFHQSIKNDDEAAFVYGEIGAGFRLAKLVWVVASWTGYSADSLPGGQFALTVAMGK
jgi:hypothetical protein